MGIVHIRKGDEMSIFQIEGIEHPEILPVNDIIAKYREEFPGGDIEELELDFDGARFRYKILGLDDDNRFTITFNAVTGSVLRKNSKPLGRKHRGGVRRARKAVDLENLIDIPQATEIAREFSRDYRPFEWELEREGDITLWEIEFASESGDKVIEVKVHAQEGTILEVEFPT